METRSATGARTDRITDRPANLPCIRAKRPERIILGSFIVARGEEEFLESCEGIMTTNRVPTIFVGGLAHETHSFSNARTPILAFEAYEWADADRLIETYRGTKTSVGGVIDGADQANLAIKPGFYAFAIPSGPVPNADYEVLAGKLIESLQ